MKTNSGLFNLIQSMSRSEKGYFKKFAGLHVIGDGNHYIQLFNCIEKQKEYDEEKVKSEISETRSTQNIAVEK